MTITLNRIQSIANGLNLQFVSGGDTFTSVLVDWDGGDGMLFLSGSIQGGATVKIAFVPDGLTGSSFNLLNATAATSLNPFAFWMPKGTVQLTASVFNSGDRTNSFEARLVSLQKAD